ncbi:hypothetical protein [Actinophytocola oryzae]|uniref:Lipoprotein n=1 Tax=Actinophytocola oryzae TaxID=502181 RepID=A0A4R7W1V5_9PSEU|nr:hypothetical protein [Actinophytocola oryzae]TDV56546.1 hypothetical protein CLV71_102613 [Actinophytocola oryzae]
MIVRWLVVGVAVAGLALVSGCSVDQRADDAARQAGRFVNALRANDLGTACELLAPNTASHLTRPHETCGQALPTLSLPVGDVRDASVWSDRAQVHTSDDTLFLVELDSGWRVDAAGCTRAERDTYDCTLASG